MLLRLQVAVVVGLAATKPPPPPPSTLHAECFVTIQQFAAMPHYPEVKSVWFLPRTRDRPVASAMSLGSIIESPWTPEEALNDESPPAIPPKLLRSREETSWNWTREFERSRGGGLFASFLQFLGVGGEMIGTVERTHTDVYAADRMLTQEFSPDKRYLEQCLQDEGVRDMFVGPGKKSKVYMITGLKTAYGATKAMEMMKKRGMHAQISVDVSTVGALSLGPKVDISSSATEKLGAAKSDFVFGFKLRRLRYKKGAVTDEAFDRGAQYGLSQGDDGDHEVEVLDVEDFDIEGVEDSPAEEFRMESKDVKDGEEDVRILHPF
jgi:hypothetical protein